MKTTLAKKSTKQMIVTIIVLVITLLIAYSIFSYYHFIYGDIDIEIKIIFLVLLLSSLILFLQSIFLITNPKIMMMYDQDGIYIYGRNHAEQMIKFIDIIDVHVTVNIWMKPFLVYSSIVIKTNQGVTTIKDIEKMNDVKDFIHHRAFEMNQD